MLREQFENVIVLSDEFYEEVVTHNSDGSGGSESSGIAPAVLDLFMWLSHRCFVAKGTRVHTDFRPMGIGQPDRIGRVLVRAAIRRET